jgi:NADH-quinone oxidoreductase subunit M
MIAWTIYLTFGGGVLVLVLPRAFARWVALFATIAGLALGTVVFVGTPIADLAHFTTIVRVPWVPALGMNYHLALDGISLTMVLVTGISAVSTVLFSWDVEHRQNEFFSGFCWWWPGATACSSARICSCCSCSTSW